MKINDIVNLLTIFQLISFAVYLVVVPNSRKTSNRFLAFFFFIQSTCVLDSIIWRYFEWSVNNILQFIFIPITLLKLWGPAFYLYVKSVNNPASRLKLKDILHTTPAILFTLFLTIHYYRFPVQVKRELLIHNMVMSGLESNIVYILTQLLNLSYITLSLICLSRYKKEIRSFYSSDEKIDLKWLRFIVFGFSGLWILDVINYSVNLITGSPTVFIHFVYPAVFILAVYAAFHSWIHPRVFIQNGKKPKYEKYQLTEEQKKEYLEDLLKVMDADKPYLIPDLTLTMLSEKSTIPARYLSQVLNESLNQNFYDFINGYRIKEAQNYLINSVDKKMTIMEILYEVGFNSKTAFNAAFKKNTGMTPSEYKKSLTYERAEVV